MFVPQCYREPDGSWITEVIQRNPLALLTSTGDHEVPFATHLPVIPDPARNPELPDDITGSSLLCHMNRVNPHWATLRDGGMVLLIFTGPHGYVSPTVYGTSPCAPTWDFTAVHVRGVVQRIAAGEDTLSVVRSTVRACEATVGTGWDMSASLDYFRKLAPGVGAFRVTVMAVDGMFKLSQEQPPEIRARVHNSFAHSAHGRHREVADLIDRLPGA